MATVVSHVITNKGKALMDRFLKYYKENQAAFVCAMLSMNGLFMNEASNVYPLYKALTE